MSSEIEKLSEERQRLWREKDGAYFRPGYAEWLAKRLWDAYADKRKAELERRRRNAKR